MGVEETEANQRRHLRIEVALQVKFSCIENLENMIKVRVVNLSRGGIFICTDRLRKKGQRVEIELPVSNSQTVKIQGTIRHVRSIDGQPHGIGIEFNELRGPALQVVEDLISRTAGLGH